VLADKLLRPPSDSFRLLILLPAHPNNGADDTRGQLGVLAAADGGEQRFLACAAYSRSGPRSSPIYVHAKVAIVDDAWLSIGSANLNEHSLFNDTEMNVVTCESDIARPVRCRLWSEHLERPSEEVGGDPQTVTDTLWRPIADEQLERRRAGAPLTHKIVRLPGVSRRSRRLLGPIQGFLVDG
jgi:phosphatidylserine/phosphatidylglycerophosphate/cardiolipin synthase-like enzyme